MTDLFVWFVYFGGVFTAYWRERDDGNGAMLSAFFAALWPMNFGHYIARRFYVTDRELDAWLEAAGKRKEGGE